MSGPICCQEPYGTNVYCWLSENAKVRVPLPPLVGGSRPRVIGAQRPVSRSSSVHAPIRAALAPGQLAAAPAPLGATEEAVDRIATRRPGRHHGAARRAGASAGPVPLGRAGARRSIGGHQPGGDQRVVRSPGGVSLHSRHHDRVRRGNDVTLLPASAVVPAPGLVPVTTHHACWPAAAAGTKPAATRMLCAVPGAVPGKIGHLDRYRDRTGISQNRHVQADAGRGPRRRRAARDIPVRQLPGRGRGHHVRSHQHVVRGPGLMPGDDGHLRARLDADLMPGAGNPGVRGNRRSCRRNSNCRGRQLTCWAQRTRRGVPYRLIAPELV